MPKRSALGVCNLIVKFWPRPPYEVPERALQIATDVGRWCSGWASDVLGGEDRWLSGLASHSSAQAVIAQTLRDRGREWR